MKNVDENQAFWNIEYTYKDYSDKQLRRKYKWFKILSNPFFYKILNITTPLLSIIPNWALKFVKKFGLYQYFISGETSAECLNCADILYKNGISSIPDFCIERIKHLSDGDKFKNEMGSLMALAKLQTKKIPIVVFKLSGIVPFDWLERLNSKLKNNEQLSLDENQVLKTIIYSIDEMCKKADTLGIRIMADAEESWIQDTIDYVILKMQEKYNKTKAVVINTYQMYKEEGIVNLKKNIRLSHTSGFILGCKLVRGAYMEAERDRAAKMNYQCPIFKYKIQTDEAFNSALEFCLTADRLSFLLVASHNSESITRLVEFMTKNNIPPNTASIHISQLYGMGDVLTYNLSKNGFNVSKYLPYGPIKESIPYLSRRASENSSTRTITSSEASILLKEINRRKKLGEDEK